VIPRGTPLAMYVPVREKTLDLEIVEETPELKRDNRVAVLGVNSKFKKRWKDYATKCPYKK
jgi:hypothetical protein